MQKGSAWKILFRGLGSLVIFLILIGIGNLLLILIAHPFYHFFIDTLNQSIVYIVIIHILFVLAEVFSVLPFPFSLPYPIFNGFAAVYLTHFIFELLKAADYLIGLELNLNLSIFRSVTIAIVFFLVILVGYIRIGFRSSSKGKEKDQKTEKPKKVSKKNK